MRRFVTAGCWLLALLILAGVCQAETRRYALVVGVREYPASEKLNKLPYAETDATALAATLKKTGYQVILMTQAAAQGEGNQRFAPNEKLVRREFERLVKTPFLEKADCVLVILAGHGIQLASKTDAKKLTYYFCASDAEIDDLAFSEDVQPQHNLIPVDDIYGTLKTCQAGVRLLVVDACRNDPSKPNEFRSGNSVTRPSVPVPPGGIAALFSCSANERAVEDARLQHGVFSHYLLEALGGAGDSDRDGELTITELHRYAARKTFDYVNQNYGRQQLPELTGQIQGWAAVASLSPVKPAPLPTPTPMPQPKPDQLAVGTKAGEVRTLGGVKFCWCPPGSFQMGSPKSEIDALLKANSSLKREWFDNETQVSVRLTRGFWLGQTEVTQALWESVMGTTPWAGKNYVKAGDGYPATYVSWEDASEFCVKLTTKGHSEGWLPKEWKLDLPTEAQWEYACRAGTETAYSFGNDESKLSEYAWWGGFVGDGNAKTEQYAHLVGQKKANAWGLYDMHGNVWEWCRDWYAEKLPGGTDPEAVQTATLRVFRGGGWDSSGGYCRSADRGRNTPDLRYFGLGFRLALVPR